MNKWMALPIILALAVLAGLALRGGDAPTGTGAPMVDVTVPDLAGDALTGAALFAGNCVACHGAQAAGRDGAGPPLVHVIYEPDHHGDAYFQLAVTNGVRAHHWRFGDMPPVQGLDAADVARITVYIRTLQRANGIF